MSASGADARMRSRAVLALSGLRRVHSSAARRKKSPHAHFHYLGGSAQPAAIQYHAIRDDRWKLTVTVSADQKIAPAELYDLGSDLGEKFDRVKQHPEIAARLAAAAQAFHDELRANIRPAGRRAAAN